MKELWIPNTNTRYIILDVHIRTFPNHPYGRRLLFSAHFFHFATCIFFFFFQFVRFSTSWCYYIMDTRMCGFMFYFLPFCTGFVIRMQAFEIYSVEVDGGPGLFTYQILNYSQLYIWRIDMMFHWECDVNVTKWITLLSDSQYFTV